MENTINGVVSEHEMPRKSKFYSDDCNIPKQ